MSSRADGMMARYDAFLLRVWRSEGGEGGQWSARLEYLPAGQSLRFADLDALLAHMRTVLCHGSAYLPGLGLEDLLVVDTGEKGAE